MRKTIWIAGVVIEIQIECLPNTSEMCQTCEPCWPILVAIACQIQGHGAKLARTMARDHIRDSRTMARDHIRDSRTMARDHIRDSRTMARDHIRDSRTMARDHIRDSRTHHATHREQLLPLYYHVDCERHAPGRDGRTVVSC
jgi:hypothetical protein